MGAQPVSRLSRRFGPSALRTPANVVTALRFALTVPLLRIIVEDGVSWRAAMGWIVLACTDGLDGWLARRDGTTRSGAFLDPLADKVVVLAAMAVMIANGVFWWVPVAIIAVREAGLIVYRSSLGRRGVSIPARSSAKLKTVVQDLSVGAALLPGLSDHLEYAKTILWIAVALTLITGMQYLLDGRRVGNAV